MGLSGLFPLCALPLWQRSDERGLAGGMPQPHPGTLSLEQKHSTDGSHHGEGEDGQDVREVPESLSIQCILWLRSSPGDPGPGCSLVLGRPPSLSSSVDPLLGLPAALPCPTPNLSWPWTGHSGPFLKRPPPTAKHLGTGARPTPGSRSAPAGGTRSRPQCGSAPTAAAAPEGSALPQTYGAVRDNAAPHPIPRSYTAGAGRSPGCAHVCTEHARAGWGPVAMLLW